MPRPLHQLPIHVASATALAAILTWACPLPAQDAELDVAFVLLPPGRFLMGSPDREWGARVDEQQHGVTLTRGFLLGATEVTQRQWRALMGANPSYLYDCPDCPVEGLTWLQAVAFCNAFSAQAGLAPAYAIDDTVVAWDRDADGYRLPTEAEWEYACRAGTTTPFSTGACLGTDQANYCGYGPLEGCPSGLWRDQSLPVASFPPNPWGLHDMHGNVSEYCWDRHAYHRAGPVTDPAGPLRGRQRVARGGGFHDFARECRSACRELVAPDEKQRWTGLRLARNAPPGAGGR